MSLTARNSITKGECAYCGEMDVTVKVVRGDLMCDDCIALEAAVVTTTTVADATRVVETIEVKSDIFTAGTVSFMEMRAAIFADASIPDDAKEYAYVKACHDQMQHLQRVAFDARKVVLESEKAAKELQSEVLKNIGKLRADEQEKFKVRDFSYEPKSPKITKPKAIKAPTKRFSSADAAALYDAAKKYGVPHLGVRSMMVSRPGMSADAAAKELSVILGISISK